MGRVFVCLVHEGLQDRQVGGLVPPRESPVRRGVRVERADLPVAGIEDGDGVADLPVRVDGEREQLTLVLPRERRDVSETHQGAGRHRPHDDVDALALLVLGLVTPDCEIRPVIGEGERLDVFDHLLFAGPQVHQTQRIMHWLALPSRIPLVGRDADRVREPRPVAGEGGPGPERDHHNGVRVGSVDAQLALVAHPVDRNGHPSAVGREDGAAEPLPLVVVVGTEGRLVLTEEVGRTPRER